jgi:nucleoside-diphosphate-sugar epimerase
VDAVKKRGRGFTIGEGKNVNSLIHVRDLAAAIILLLGEVLGGGEKAGWREKGRCYVEHGETVFVDMANAIVKEMAKKGVISEEGLVVLTEKETKELHPYAEVLWGSNIRFNAERIRQLG